MHRKSLLASPSDHQTKGQTGQAASKAIVHGLERLLLKAHLGRFGVRLGLSWCPKCWDIDHDTPSQTCSCRLQTRSTPTSPVLTRGSKLLRESPTSYNHTLHQVRVSVECVKVAWRGWFWVAERASANRRAIRALLGTEAIA
jgi:hypothetical protein